MRRAPAVVSTLAAVGLGVALLPGVAVAAPTFTPGAPGIGDPYFPLDGNGGYDVRQYALDLTYEPDTDLLTGAATITARATQDLSAFNLDFEGLTVRSVTVDGRPATWSRDGGELTVTPSRGIVDDRRFVTVVTYDGVPETLGEPPLGQSGFFHTDDGAVVVGQPDVAATWFPANDHPRDEARFSFEITAPTGLQVLANGVLEGSTDEGAVTTWRWRAAEPMAPYLAMMAIGDYAVEAYEADGIPYWDAIDRELFVDALPRTGEQFAWSQADDLSYKRLVRTIEVPAGGATLSFWVDRETEAGWDFFFVEAHTPGQDDWTTLPAGAATSQDVGSVCPFSLELHPFLERYQAASGDTCEPRGTTGEWWAASGSSEGYEQWTVDLGAWVGGSVEVSLSYVSDDVVQERGVILDDVTVSTGAGSTSFEADADPLDGWVVAGAPEGSAANDNDWTTAVVDDLPPTTGEIAAGSLDRQAEITAFLESVFGPYPFSTSGGVVDAEPRLGFALETQTRPVYSRFFFTDSISGDSVVVHELAHQWVGDDLALDAWQHIWLNEGFASYAEWLWSEHDGLATAQENFDFWYSAFPEDDPFWQVVIGDPGPDSIFEFAVYQRGAMALHQLRLAVGDGDFFRIVRGWVRQQAGGLVTTDEFIAVAEEVSGQQLDELFQTWLFTPGRPELPAADAAAAARSGSATSVPPLARVEAKRLATAP